MRKQELVYFEGGPLDGQTGFVKHKKDFNFYYDNKKEAVYFPHLMYRKVKSDHLRIYKFREGELPDYDIGKD